MMPALPSVLFAVWLGRQLFGNTYYDSLDLDEAHVPSWDEFRTLILERYCQDEEGLMSKLKTRGQMEGEGAREFADALKGMNKSLGDSALPLKLLQHLFTQGLHSFLRDRVVAQMPSSLEEAVGFATHFELYAKGKGRFKSQGSYESPSAIQAGQPPRPPRNYPQVRRDRDPPRRQKRGYQ